MPNSGAFRSLHCLIYKVLARAAQRRNICYPITSDSVCQVLFSTFFKIFFRTQLSEPSAPQTACLFYQTFQSLSSTFSSFLKTFSGPAALRVSALDSLLILADSNPFVKYFSRLFSNFFHPLAAHARFRVEKLCYFTTCSSVCQAFFSTFFKLFLPCRPFALPCRTAQLI